MIGEHLMHRLRGKPDGRTRPAALKWRRL
jgi:hypothetical protein